MKMSALFLYFPQKALDKSNKKCGEALEIYISGGYAYEIFRRSKNNVMEHD